MTKSFKMTEYEVLNHERRLTLEEGVSIALEKADLNVQMKLKENEKIMTRKVLKKSKWHQIKTTSGIHFCTG
mgnify:CR=1 FL=1